MNDTTKSLAMDTDIPEDINEDIDFIRQAAEQIPPSPRIVPWGEVEIHAEGGSGGNGRILRGKTSAKTIAIQIGLAVLVGIANGFFIGFGIIIGSWIMKHWY